MERPKLNLVDLLDIEFNREYLQKNWLRLTVLLLVLLGILAGLALFVVHKLKPEEMVRIEVTVLKKCEGGGEVLLEQKVAREVYASQVDKAPREEIIWGICDHHLYQMAVREEEYGRSRFYDDVVQIRAVIVKRMGEEEMAMRLIKVLQDKYPQAQHYDIRVDKVHFDFNRAGVLIQRYE